MRSRGLGAGVFPGLELLGGLLTAEQFLELVALRVEHIVIEVAARGDSEHVHDFAGGRAQSGRADEDHLVELLSVIDRHLGGEPAAEREADDVGGSQFLFADKTRVESREVAHVHNPVGDGGLAEARMVRNPQRALLRQRGMPAEPAGMAQLAMEHK